MRITQQSSRAPLDTPYPQYFALVCYATKPLPRVGELLGRLVAALPAPAPRSKLYTQLGGNAPLDHDLVRELGLKHKAGDPIISCHCDGTIRYEDVGDGRQLDRLLNDPSFAMLVAKFPNEPAAAFKQLWTIRYHADNHRVGGTDPTYLSITLRTSHLVDIGERAADAAVAAPTSPLGLMEGWNQYDKRSGVARATRNAFMRSLISAIAVPGFDWDFGLVEAGDESEVDSGALYESSLGEELRWHRMVEYHAWDDPSTRDRYPARGVYWGNLLGPRILARLGGREAFQAAFAHKASERLVKQGWSCNVGNSSLFVAMSDDPLDALYQPGQLISPPRGPAELGAWLRRQLRDANVLM